MSPLLYRLIAVEYRSDAAATIELHTNLPGSMALRQTITLPSTGGVRGVMPPFPLAAGTKGQIFDVKVTAPAAGYIAIYKISLWVRRLGRTASDWQWAQVQLPFTGEEWTKLRVPVPPTAEEWARVSVPVPPTAEEWSRLTAPVPATSEQWGQMSVPVPPTPEEWARLDMPELPRQDDQHRWHDFAMDE